MRIAIDISGGDFAPKAQVEGALLALEKLHKEDTIVLIGKKSTVDIDLIEKLKGFSNHEWIESEDSIEMGEHPVKALMKKPNSEIAIGFRMLKEKSIDTFASCGNTGAMLVGSVQILKSIQGVIRPCITTIMPKLSGGLGIILDVGTNADCKPDVLYQFGLLGSLFAEYVYGITNPKVGLMNIGEEAEKGNLVAQAAYQIMQDSKDFNFIGNVEGRDILNNKADVYVCEGFTGNIILKEAEAFYTAIKKRGINDEFFNRFNYELYGGTPILGINSTVMIGHGSSSPLAVCNMLLLSKEIHKAHLPEKIYQAFNK